MLVTNGASQPVSNGDPPKKGKGPGKGPTHATERNEAMNRCQLGFV